jgi:hypothetical protein
MAWRIICKTFGLLLLYCGAFLLLALIQYSETREPFIAPDTAEQALEVPPVEGEGEAAVETELAAEGEDTPPLDAEEPAIAENAPPAVETPSYAEFTIPDGMEKARYDKRVTDWCFAAFTGWEQRINAGNLDENTVTNFLVEAARRGVLDNALSMIPAEFRSGSAQSYLSAPFLGELNAHLDELITFEREKSAIIASATSADPAAYLTGDRVFEYLAERNAGVLLNAGVNYIASLTPSGLSIGMCAGIFEGWLALRTLRGGRNPFEAVLPAAKTLIRANIKKDAAGEHVFVTNGIVDTQFNLRLGVALKNYGENASEGGWAAIGRSLVLSVLSFAGEASSVSGWLEMTADGLFTASSGGVLRATQIYPLLKVSGFYPHVFGIAQNGGMELWTVSPSIRASFQNNTLTLDISFPAGGTHYMYLSNVPPFSKIQMRGMDYNSDPRFEQYLAPGWSYSDSEQVLMMKMVHTNNIERVSILF